MPTYEVSGWGSLPIWIELEADNEDDARTAAIHTPLRYWETDAGAMELDDAVALAVSLVKDDAPA